MFLACHLFAGVLIGVVLAVHLRDRRLLLFAAAGALLPDLIDKPLGHIVLHDSIDDGRIFMHGLFLALVLLFIGLYLWRRRGSFAAGALACGILSHQILDTMWEVPVSWYYPLLGPYQPGDFPDFLAFALWSEVGSLSEWVFAASSAIVLLLAFRETAEAYLGSRAVALAGRVFPAAPFLSAGMGAVALGLFGAGVESDLLMVGDSPQANLILALAGIGGAAVLTRYRDSAPLAWSGDPRHQLDLVRQAPLDPESGTGGRLHLDDELSIGDEIARDDR
ncbi:metal-dependent hydrolase [Methanoculleus sp. FWC-SCC1]|uniref:Metal-dependent hydrolase n=1 Tax=Methanoculleus frigidifontis TaxID=2584085 RepID=A0ABT8M8P5_9EURY|nr:metal-dependent hydrolase [Methanoculleus sp. FWC-SCC1]